ncbi:hypothetical protein [Roseibium sp. RKSG952]|uniref:hypothetical protein n=1 Tax=Roseibium sp. RKSG952 TaxID=2529384 RepID=UPI0012BCBB1C|nr:hypothetical protein [Roseibium sp. RKSG952]MTH94848.1 hypothetical protein [Roseibium sp. RKSG952]
MIAKGDAQDRERVTMFVIGRRENIFDGMTTGLLESQEKLLKRSAYISDFLEAEGQKLRSSGWTDTIQPIMKFLNSHSVNAKVLREVDQVLGLDLEARFLKRNQDTENFEITTQETDSNIADEADFTPQIKEVENQKNELEESIHLDDLLLVPIRQLSEDLEGAGFPDLLSEEGDAFWQSMKNKFFIFGVQKRAAVKALSAFEAENSVSPAAKERLQNVRRGLHKASRCLHEDLVAHHMRLKAMERLKERKDQTPVLEFGSKAAMVPINHEAILKVEALVGSDLAAARRCIVLGDVLFKLKKDVDKIVVELIETSDLLQELRRAARQCPTNILDVNIDEVNSEVSDQNKTLRLLLDQCMNFAHRGLQMNKMGLLPIWDGAVHGDLHGFEAAVREAISSGTFAGGGSLDISNLGASGRVDNRTADAGIIDIPLSSLPYTEITVRALSPDFNKSFSSSSIEDSSFGVGFDR